MSTNQIVLTGVLPIAEGKMARAIELFQALIQGIYQNEPGSLRYHLHKSTTTNELVMIETYESAKAHEKHEKTSWMAEMMKATRGEGVLARPPRLKTRESVAGFESRSEGLLGKEAGADDRMRNRR